MDGFGAMLSFEVAGGAAPPTAVCERVEVLTNATSLGGVETLIERRARYPLELAPEGLLRISVGLRGRRGPVARPRAGAGALTQTRSRRCSITR